jgi:hypothetical protein
VTVVRELLARRSDFTLAFVRHRPNSRVQVATVLRMLRGHDSRTTVEAGL